MSVFVAVGRGPQARPSEGEGRLLPPPAQQHRAQVESQIGEGVCLPRMKPPRMKPPRHRAAAHTRTHPGPGASQVPRRRHLQVWRAARGGPLLPGPPERVKVPGSKKKLLQIDTKDESSNRKTVEGQG